MTASAAGVPPEFLHERWESWPDPGVCIAHGQLVGADVDTDRRDVADAVGTALGPSPVRRRGRKGWMGYYRPGSGCAELGARLRWYHPEVCTTGEDGRRSWPPLVELLLHGAQSVVPPTIHPDTGQPYIWLTSDTLEDTPLRDLPELPADPVARLDAELGKLGLALARWSATTMIQNIASHIADNQTERDVNDVERFICEAGDRGRTWREVQRKFRRVRARDLKEICESLEREGSIRVETTPTSTGGWPVKTAFPV